MGGGGVHGRASREESGTLRRRHCHGWTSQPGVSLRSNLQHLHLAVLWTGDHGHRPSKVTRRSGSEWREATEPSDLEPSTRTRLAPRPLPAKSSSPMGLRALTTIHRGCRLQPRQHRLSRGPPSRCMQPSTRNRATRALPPPSSAFARTFPASDSGGGERGKVEEGGTATMEP